MPVKIGVILSSGEVLTPFWVRKHITRFQYVGRLPDHPDQALICSYEGTTTALPHPTTVNPGNPFTCSLCGTSVRPVHSPPRPHNPSLDESLFSLSSPLSITYVQHAQTAWHPAVHSPPLKRPSQTTASASLSPSPRPSLPLRSLPTSRFVSLVDRSHYASPLHSSAFRSPFACAPTIRYGSKTGKPSAWALNPSPVCAVAGPEIST